MNPIMACNRIGHRARPGVARSCTDWFTGPDPYISWPPGSAVVSLTYVPVHSTRGSLAVIWSAARVTAARRPEGV